MLFRDITVRQAGNSDVVIISDGPGSEIHGVTFENVTINGQKLRPNDPRLKTNPGVSNVTVR